MLVGAWLVGSLVQGCRCQGDRQAGGESGAAGAPTASASVLASAQVSAPGSASAAASGAPAVAVGSPWSAARRGSEVFVAGARRDGPGVVAVRLNDGVVESFELKESSTIERPSSLDVVASKGGVALRLDDRQGQGKWWRGASWGELREASPEGSSSAVCAIGERLLGVQSGESASLRRWPFGAGEGEAVAALKTSGATSLYCDTRRAYLVADDGKSRTLLAIEEGKTIGPVALDSKGDEQGLSYSVDQDALMIARLSAKGELALRSWGAEAAAPSPWVIINDKFDAGSVIEMVMQREGKVALVMARHVDAEGCKNGETSHTIGELVVVDVAQRALARPRVRLDQWACGAEPGPFGGGAAARGFVVSWPRGIDAACARAGARYGGIGFVEVPLDGGAAKPGRREAPGSDMADLGCEGASCGAVVLARGDESGCWPAADARSHSPRWITYP